jgi:hypothetical protein
MMMMMMMIICSSSSKQRMDNKISVQSEGFIFISD